MNTFYVVMLSMLVGFNIYIAVLLTVMFLEKPVREVAE